MDEKETAIQQKSKVKPAKFMGQRQMIVENNDKKGMCKINLYWNKTENEFSPWLRAKALTKHIGGAYGAFARH